jgi:hypothetical protein
MILYCLYRIEQKVDENLFHMVCIYEDFRHLSKQFLFYFNRLT